MTQYKRAILEPAAKSGVKPSMARLLDMVNEVPPGARAKTISVPQDMAAAGIELDESAIDIAIKLGRQQEPVRRFVTKAPKTDRADDAQIVYYIRRGGLIKIGTTNRPQVRFRSLLPDEILAFEPGGREVEFARHRQFSHLRTGRNCEHFYPAADFLEHVQQIRDAFGDPDPDWPTAATIGRGTLPDLDEPETCETATVTEAAEMFGIKRATIYMWAHRKRIYAAGLNRHGHQVYYVDQLRQMAAAHRPRRGLDYAI